MQKNSGKATAVFADLGVLVGAEVANFLTVKKKKKSVIPVALISLIAGSLITLSIIYKPSWIKPDNLPDIREVFQIVETVL